MPERTMSSNEYRYGFNGKEKDEEGEWGSATYIDPDTGEEMENSLTHYDYGFRIYNPGIGRFLSVDPLTGDYPFYTPYQFAGNMPIWKIDLDGKEPSESELQEQARRIMAKFENMVQDSRDKNRNIAADNLQHFLDGSGRTKILSTDWLRDFSTVRNAEDRVKSYFEYKENNMPSWANEAIKLGIGGTIEKKDYWVGDIHANSVTELYYASNASKIVGSGVFELKKESDVIIDVHGSVTMNWFDPYNWNKGGVVYVPGTGLVWDSEALFLEEHEGASRYLLSTAWTLNLHGKYDVSKGKFTEKEWILTDKDHNLHIILTPVLDDAGNVINYQYKVPKDNDKPREPKP